jgi:hypothetical protein
MKRIKLFTIVLLLGTTTSTPLNAQSLSYSRLTNGLDDPYFEGGRSIFKMDDINMDGHVDILTIGDHGSPFVGSNQHGICVWFGDDQGNFENYMAGDFGYGGIAIGDVNNDGFKDVGYGMHHDYSSTDFGDQLIEVALGDGSGMNWEPWDNGLATHGQSWGMFGTDLGDVNNNGFLDLVSISFGSGDGMHVYLNQQNGNWERSFGFLQGNSDMLVEFADFDNDGYLDFVSGHEFGTAYFGDGMGDFVNNDNGLPAMAQYENRFGVSKGDVNNDGAADIAFVNQNAGIEVYFFEKTFTQSWVSLSGDLPQTGNFSFTQIADMNGDGFADIAAMAGQTISIWLGDGQGNWTPDATFTLGVNASPKAFHTGGDLTKNGHPDIVLLANVGSWPSYQNHFYCFAEISPADSLWIKPIYPKGFENFYPGSTRFIEWASEVPNGDSSSVTIEISAFGEQGPWWMLAENIPNNGRHQWIVPDYGSVQVFLKLTVSHSSGIATTITPNPFNIFGLPTKIDQPFDTQKIIIYPNPGDDFIAFYNQQEILKFSLYDLSGRLITEITPEDNRIDVSHLESGAYFYNAVLISGNRITGKWIKR